MTLHSRSAYRAIFVILLTALAVPAVCGASRPGGGEPGARTDARAGLARLDPGSIDFVSASVGWLTGFDVSTNKGVIYRTTNGGSTWRLQTTRGAYGGSLFALSSSYCWCADGYVLRTSNGGSTWQRFAPRMVVTGVRFVTATKGFGVAVDGSGSGPCWLLRTANGGASWIKCRTVGDFPSFGTPDFVDTSHGWTARGSRVLSTANGGKTWAACGTLSGQPANAAPAVDFVTRSVGWASGAHVWKTTNGGKTWKRQDPPGASSFAALHMQSRSSGWVQAGDALYRTTNGGATWVKRFSWPGLQFNFDVNGRCCWVWGKVGGDNLLTRSTNNGLTWQTLHQGPYL